MRMIGVLVWYEEASSWLGACVTSMARAGCQHLVAVDGAYAIYPNARAQSGTEQHASIIESCNACQMGLTLHIPQEPWMGNEVEKRSHAFTLAEQEAEPNMDWYFLMDADQVVTAAPGLRDQLEATEYDVAELLFWQRYDHQRTEKQAKTARQFDFPRTYEYPVRCLFRAVPGLHLEGNHYTYVDREGRLLWGNAATDDLAPALQLPMVKVEHRTDYRDVARKREQQSYYERRDKLGIEVLLCSRCKEKRGIGTGFVDVEITDDGYAAQPVPVCGDCAPLVRAEVEQAFRDAGEDPKEFLKQSYPVSA